MECRNCGASNLDGAERCSACGTQLVAFTEDSRPGEILGNPTRSTWLLAGFIAVALVALGAVLLSGVGGGIGGGATEPPLISGESGSMSTTYTPTPDEIDWATDVADAVVSDGYPRFAEATSTVVAYARESGLYYDVTYGILVPWVNDDGEETLLPRILTVVIEKDTGEHFVLEMN